jgi:hypothetical protein
VYSAKNIIILYRRLSTPPPAILSHGHAKQQSNLSRGSSEDIIIGQQVERLFHSKQLPRR